MPETGTADAVEGRGRPPRRSHGRRRVDGPRRHAADVRRGASIAMLEGHGRRRRRRSPRLLRRRKRRRRRRRRRQRRVRLLGPCSRCAATDVELSVSAGDFVMVEVDESDPAPEGLVRVRAPQGRGRAGRPRAVVLPGLGGARRVERWRRRSARRTRRRARAWSRRRAAASPGLAVDADTPSSPGGLVVDGADDGGRSAAHWSRSRFRAAPRARSASTSTTPTACGGSRRTGSRRGRGRRGSAISSSPSPLRRHPVEWAARRAGSPTAAPAPPRRAARRVGPRRARPWRHHVDPAAQRAGDGQDPAAARAALPAAASPTCRCRAGLWTHAWRRSPRLRARSAKNLLTPGGGGLAASASWASASSARSWRWRCAAGRRGWGSTSLRRTRSCGCCRAAPPRRTPSCSKRATSGGRICRRATSSSPSTEWRWAASGSWR